MARKTEIPNLRGCPKGNWWFGLRLHNWEWRPNWNGNDRKVLPFVTTTRGIARSGWRCRNCGEFVWGQSDQEFAASVAVAGGYATLPAESLPPNATPATVMSRFLREVQGKDYSNYDLSQALLQQLRVAGYEIRIKENDDGKHQED